MISERDRQILEQLPGWNPAEDIAAQRRAWEELAVAYNQDLPAIGGLEENVELCPGLCTDVAVPMGGVTAGIARRVESKSYAPGSNGKQVAQCLSSREECTSERTNESSACSPTTRLFGSKARATLQKTGQISTALICGGSVEAGLQCSVVGRSANLHLGFQQNERGLDLCTVAPGIPWAADRPGTGREGLAYLSITLVAAGA